jgi:GNAT superfamily N-acetyltransferase
VIRPMTSDDVPAAERLSDDSFFDLDTRMHSSDGPEPERRPEHFRGRWMERTAHFVATDPGGSWVAEDGDGLVGMASSFVRDSTWILATFTVRPGAQGLGVGRRLLDRAVEHGAGTDQGMLCASSDPKALRSYHRIGLDLHPYMHFRGTVRRSAVPAVGPVRDGSADDVELLDAIDRSARGAGHGPDHAVLMKQLRLVVDPAGHGYAYLRPDTGDVTLLAATEDATAARLAWTAVAEAPGEVRLGRITPVMRWAMDVGMTAGLSLRQDGYLGLRGMAPPATYIPDGMFL